MSTNGSSEFSTFCLKNVVSSICSFSSYDFFIDTLNQLGPTTFDLSATLQNHDRWRAASNKKDHKKQI